MQPRPSITISSDLGVTSTSRCNGTTIISLSCIVPCIESRKTIIYFEVLLPKWASNMSLNLDNGQVIIVCHTVR
jgi:hypothetical protein